MNSAIIFVCFAAGIALAQSAAAPSLKEKMTALSKKCAQETKATPEQTKVLFSRALPGNDEEKCFLECMYNGAGLIKDGKFSVEGSKKLASMRFQKKEDLVKANALIDVCGKEITKKDGEKCSLGSGVRACTIKHAKDVQFFSSH